MTGSQTTRISSVKPALGPERVRATPEVVGVSVVVVCWNAADTLDKCLRQLLGQDYDEYEVIVIDDGSTDDSLKVARRGLSSGKLSIFRSPDNRGCAQARNLGLRHARGEIVAFIDADGFAAADWLSELVRPFELDPTVGAVASTVLFAANPHVINGAGGQINRRGEGIDLNFGEPYERAELRDEVLYPMGCGMAIRRSVADQVGEFDGQITNYYDDVDFGIRVWRAGYRVVLAQKARIEHEFELGAGVSARKQLLCEQHRMRVMLKHAPARELMPWAIRELRSTGRTDSQSRALKRKAARWNARHLISAVTERCRLRRARRPPTRLFDHSWERSPVPPPRSPDVARASNRVDMADPGADESLLYGWYEREQADGYAFRWAAPHAGVLVRLAEPGLKMHLHCRFPSGIDMITLTIRPTDASRQVTQFELRAHQSWSEDTYPLDLAPGDYEFQFDSPGPITPGSDLRTLGVGLSQLRVESKPIELARDLDMAADHVADQLVLGWQAAERGAGRRFRWTGARAVAVVRLREPADKMSLVYQLPPQPIGPVEIRLRAIASAQNAWCTQLRWQDDQWHEQTWSLSLPPGDYEICVSAPDTWAVHGRDERGIALALSSLCFEPIEST